MEKKRHKIYVIIYAIVFLGLTIITWAKPEGEFSVTERRPLEQFPTLNVQTVFSGKFMGEFEEYTLDQFPFRDMFRSVKAITHRYVLAQNDNNGVYLADGYVSKLDYPLSEKAMNNAVKKFDHIYKKYIEGTDAKVYYSLIPDKNCFLAEKHGFPSYSFESMEKYMNQKLSNMTYIDISNVLSVEDFYHTDTHWKQENILKVAENIANMMGTALQNEYEKVTLETPFYGVYYGQLGLPIAPDTLSYLNHDMFEHCIVTNHENGKQISIYELDKAVGRDPYELFLHGSLSVITIENPNATSDKELVMFRDSFGSSLAPLLVEGYAKITLLDVRYLNENLIGKYVTFDNQDVLFIHSSGVMNNENAFK